MENFNILPVEMSLQIFGLLAIDSVSHCALVSKSWKNLIHSPSFYAMHKERLLHLAGEAQADVKQKIKELNELCESFRQDTQTCLFELEESQEFEEKINSLILSQQKLAYYTRLAVKIWAKSSEGAGEKRTNFISSAKKRTKISAKHKGKRRTNSIRLAQKCMKISAKYRARKPKVKKRNVSKNVEDLLPCWKKPKREGAAASSKLHLSDNLSVGEAKKERIFKNETSTIC